MNIFFDLDKIALVANKRVQRIELLSFNQLVFGQEVFAKRRFAEIDNGMVKGRATEPAAAFGLRRL